MGKALYLGVSSKAHKGKKAYIGVDGKARKIKKMYIGVSGKARLFWSGGGAPILYYTTKRGLVSDDGISGWKTSSSDLPFTYVGDPTRQLAAYAFGKFWMAEVKYSIDHYASYIYNSVDGITWTKTAQSFNGIARLHCVNGILVALGGSGGAVYYTKDGSTWTYDVYNPPTTWTNCSIKGYYDVVYGTFGDVTGYFFLLSVLYSTTTTYRIAYVPSIGVGTTTMRAVHIFNAGTFENIGFTLNGGNIFAFTSKQISSYNSQNGNVNSLRVWRIVPATSSSPVSATYNEINKYDNLIRFWSTDKYMFAFGRFFNTSQGFDRSYIYRYKYKDALTSVSSLSASGWGTVDSQVEYREGTLFVDGRMYFHYKNKVAYSDDYGSTVSSATITAGITISSSSHDTLSATVSAEETNGFYSD